MADPDLELRWGGGGGGGGGLDLFALLAFFPSVISSFLLKIGGTRAPPLDPLLVTYTLTKHSFAVEMRRTNLVWKETFCFSKTYSSNKGE